MALADKIKQTVALNQLQREEIRTVVGMPGFVYGGNSGVRQTGQCPGLTAEIRCVVLILIRPVANNFEGHTAFAI